MPAIPIGIPDGSLNFAPATVEIETLKQRTIAGSAIN